MRRFLLGCVFLLSACDLPLGAVDPYPPIAGVYAYTSWSAGSTRELVGQLTLAKLVENGKPLVGRFGGTYTFDVVDRGVLIGRESGQFRDGRIGSDWTLTFTTGDGRRHTGQLAQGGGFSGWWAKPDSERGAFTATPR
jgi:hypothetical protein